MATGELWRRVFHVAGGTPIGLYLIEWVSWPQIRLLYLGGIVLTMVLEAGRLLVGLDWWVFRELTREYEAGNPAGYALYVVGAAVAVLAFEPRIAVPAVLMLALVDPLSGLLGQNEFGEPKRPTVLAITFGSAALIAIPFVPLPAAVLAGFVVMVADGLTPVIAGYVIDDNVTIPVGAAVAIWLAVQLTAQI